MRSSNVINFPVQPAESERPRVYRNEPCTILLFPRQDKFKAPDLLLAKP